MYDELVKRLRDFAVELRKAEDALLVRDAADAIEELIGFVQEAERDRDEYRERLDKANDAIKELQAAEKKYLANIGALETENQHLKREREWMPVASTRDFNTVTSDLVRHLNLSCQKTDGEILWYEGTLEVLVEFLSILHQKAEEGGT